MSSNRFSRRFSAAFTLIELMVVIAILSVLAAVALPAYNNYTLKSKFAEVTLATAPTKTAISTCAVSGDCVAAGAISLSSTSAGGVPSLAQLSAGPNNVATSLNQNPALLYAVTLASYLDNGYSLSTAAAVANSFASSAGSNVYIVEPSPYVSGTFCVSTYTNPGGCNLLNATPATTQAYLTAANNPYYAAGGGSTTTMANLPCVGGSGCAPATKYVASVSYNATGVITATAQSSSGLKGETYMLTPAYSDGRVDWSASGSCKTRAGGALC